jgi:3-oxoacyl-[acyl-carrier protein] reductase
MSERTSAGQVALVTGASRGIGQAIALALAGRGDSPKSKADPRPVAQATGTVADEVPAEFRGALDKYFSGLEK